MWIKFTADHGKGHQSDTEEYQWFDYDIPESELEDYWTDWIDTFYWSDHIVGKAEIVQAPPAEAVRELLEEYQDRIKRAQQMIILLESYSIPDAPVKEEPPKIEAGWGYPLLGKKWHYFNGDWISLCGKWMYTGELEEGKDQHPDNCRACTKKLERLNKKKEN